MRTTVDIDQNLLDRIRKLAQRDGRSFREALNGVIARGLSPASRAGTAEPYRMPTYAMGGTLPGVNLHKALALADELYDEEMFRKMKLREQEPK